MGEILRFGEMTFIIRARREIRFLISCSIVKSEIQISKSKSGSIVTLEIVPEEVRLLIFYLLMKMINFFQIRWVLQMCQDFNSQDFELIIFGIVSAVCIQAPEHS